MNDDRTELEQLREQVEGLQQEVERLASERDEALAARDAMIQRVLPMATPQSEQPARSGRGLIMVLLVLALGVILLLMLYLPRAARQVGDVGRLPQGVEVRETSAGDAPER